MADIVTLPQRLLDLRQKRDTPLTQPALGRMLGVEAPTISSWERGRAIPPEERLVAYATIFSGQYDVENGNLPADKVLSTTERSARDRLLDELVKLRQLAVENAGGTPDDLLTFPNSAPVTIICGKLDPPPVSAGGHRWNYMALSAFADLDALFEMYGHLRARNPGSAVSYRLAERLEHRHLQGHLVLLGNLAWQQSDLKELLPGLPVKEIADPDVVDGEIFELKSGKKLKPKFTGESEKRRVVEDVGLVARTENPYQPSRTLTICSGVFSRGVYGAVRSLTDPDLRDANLRYLSEKFGSSTSWGVLMRVRTTDHAIATPSLTDERVRLHEFDVT